MLVTLAAALALATASNVIDLTEANFEATMAEKPLMMVEFFAPWCGHCKALAPEWEKVAKAFANEPNCVVAALDADKHREIGSKYDVSGFPTIKAFAKDDKSGEEKYTGGRTADDIVEYLNTQCGTFRTTDGSLTSAAGRVAELDELAAQFLEADDATRASLIDAAKALFESYDGAFPKAAKFYSQAMTKIVARGDDYVETEPARLTRMIDSGSLTGAKVDEFTLRLNVLAAFTEA